VEKRDFKSNITTHLFQAGTTKILLLQIPLGQTSENKFELELTFEKDELL